MEERIKAQVKDSNPAEITELILDNVRETTLVGLDDSFTSLATLSAINVGLTSLEGLPSLPSITKLELGDNKLTGGLDSVSIKCPSLKHLSLVGNRFTSVDELTPLKSLEGLLTLDLLDCPLTKKEDYRSKVFSLLPGLKSLDGVDENGVEVEESDSEVEDEGGDSEGKGDEEVGLDYLNREFDSDESSDGGDYDPTHDGEEEEEEDGDHVILSDGEGEGEGGAGEGEGGEGKEEKKPAAKRQKVEEPEQKEATAPEN